MNHISCCWGVLAPLLTVPALCSSSHTLRIWHRCFHNLFIVWKNKDVSVFYLSVPVCSWKNSTACHTSVSSLLSLIWLTDADIQLLSGYTRCSQWKLVNSPPVWICVYDIQRMSKQVTKGHWVCVPLCWFAWLSGFFKLNQEKENLLQGTAKHHSELLTK